MNRALKRLIDIGVAAAALLFASPVLLLTAVAIRLSMGTPVVFAQVRPGLRGRPFTVYKFRTMREANDRAGQPLSDEARLTGLGRFIRKTSLDELPQFWNVLKGEMTLVGPRPLLMRYLPRYTPEQARRHDVQPGITGWAQVNGRNAISWEEKFRLDTWYVDHWSLGLDLKILAMTVGKVLNRSGISQSGRETMEEFMGTETETAGAEAGAPTATTSTGPPGRDDPAHPVTVG